MERNLFYKLSILFSLLILSGQLLGGMAVSPLKQEITVRPGKETEFYVNVTNNNRGPQTQPCKVKVQPIDFYVSKEGKLQFGEEFKGERSAVDWIELSSDSFILQPGESKKVKGTVKAPLNCDGDYWAAVMIGLDNGDKGEQGVKLNLRTASGVFIRVKKRNYIERAKIKGAEIIMPEVTSNNSENDEGSVLKIKATVENTGFISFIAKGEVFIYTEGWRKIATIPLSSNRRRIFPTHSRIFEGTMSEPLPAGKYYARVFFGSDLKRGRKFTKQLTFEIDEQLSKEWTDATPFVENCIFELKPEKIDLEAVPGRFTTKRILTSNNSFNSLSVDLELDSGEIPKTWVTLKHSDFTVSQNNRKNATCYIRIPVDAERGSYEGKISAKMERSGLTGNNKNVEIKEIPISIKVK